MVVMIYRPSPAGAPISGTPCGCWAEAPNSTPMTSDRRCINGKKTFSTQQCGDLARKSYVGYKRKYPRMQIWRGARDPIVVPKNLDDQLL
jgi:acetylxylan esterase